MADGLIIGAGPKITDEPTHQIGSGCLSDQLIGQYFAHIAGLGYLLEREHVQRAMRAVLAYNFKPDLTQHACFLRTYALGDEAGMILCSWPHGEPPPLPLHFATKVWTSIEYLTATLLIYEWLVEDGLQVVEAARQRHDDERRNPWDEPEAGHHYARAMAAWALLLALAGFHYSAVSGRMQFQPALNQDDFRCFWSTPTAWGVFSQDRSDSSWTWRLSTLYGQQPLQSLAVSLAGGTKPRQVDALVGESPVAIETESEDQVLTVHFPEGVAISAGQSLIVIAT